LTAIGSPEPNPTSSDKTCMTATHGLPCKQGGHCHAKVW
jgi:hypothetical protein